MYNTSHLCPPLVDSLSSLSCWRRLSKGGLSRSNRGLWISRRCLATSNSDLGLGGGGGKGGCRLRPACDNRIEQISYSNESCQIWQWIVCTFSYSKQRNWVVSCIQFSFWPIDFFLLDCSFLSKITISSLKEKVEYLSFWRIVLLSWWKSQSLWVVNREIIRTQRRFNGVSFYATFKESNFMNLY